MRRKDELALPVDKLQPAVQQSFLFRWYPVEYKLSPQYNDYHRIAIYSMRLVSEGRASMSKKDSPVLGRRIEK